MWQIKHWRWVLAKGVTGYLVFWHLNVYQTSQSFWLLLSHSAAAAREVFLALGSHFLLAVLWATDGCMCNRIRIKDLLTLPTEPDEKPESEWEWMSWTKASTCLYNWPLHNLSSKNIKGWNSNAIHKSHSWKTSFIYCFLIDLTWIWR